MPERHSHNSRRRHSSLERLVSNQLHIHGRARQSFGGLGRREGRAGTLPHFPWLGTEEGMWLGALFWDGQPARWWRHALHVMDHTAQRIQGKDNPSSPHPQGQCRGAGGGGPLSGTAVLPVSLANRTWGSPVPKPTQGPTPMYSHHPKVGSGFWTSWYRAGLNSSWNKNAFPFKK